MNHFRRALIPVWLVLTTIAAIACGDSNSGNGAAGDDLVATINARGQTPASAPPAAAGSPTPLPGVATPPTATCGSGGSSGIGAIQRSGQREFSNAPARVIDTEKAYVARLQTNKGEIVLYLAAKDVPNHVNNFVFLSCTGYYDGLTFHRVVLTPQPFVIQSGDPKADGTGGPGYNINLEINPKWRHDTGALGMARSPAPNSAGSQFYITLSPQHGLDDGYTVFGRVLSGMEVVSQIRQGDTITSVQIEEH